MSEEMEETSIRFAPHVWSGALYKKTIDAEAGRGGIEALCPLLDKVHWIPEITDLRREIKTKSLDFERAFMKCSKERLKLKLRVRKNQAFRFLALGCPKCTFSVTMSSNRKECPKCKVPLKPLYWISMNKLMEETGSFKVSPEAVIMNAYYPKLTEAYIAGYKAWKLLLDWEAKKRGWDYFRIDNPEYRNYMDEFDLGRLVGETKISREEKQILQLIALGPIAGIEVRDAERMIRICMDVVRLGFLSEQLGMDEAGLQYGEVLRAKESLYNWMNKKIDEVLTERYSEDQRPSVSISTDIEGKGCYAPFFLMPSETWDSGSINRKVELERLYDLPIFPRSDFGALQTCYGPIGSGKTFLFSSLFSYAVIEKKELIFSPLGDKSNSFTLACMPLFSYSRNTSNLVNLLKKAVEVEPQGMPVLTLTFVRKGETMDRYNKRKNPPTKFDRLVRVDNPKNFTFDFKLAMKELKEISSEYGYKRPVGIITIRNLLEERFDREMNENTDVQIATGMIGQFDIWRKSNMTFPARVFIDEVAALARTKISLYAKDILRSGETIITLIAESRRDLVSVDLATQMPLEILPNIRDATTNVFFRNLPMMRDKKKSQIDYLVESLQLDDPALRTVVRDINNRGLLGTGYWFWYHRPNRDIQIIRPSPPTFCIQDPEAKMSNLEIFQHYEKQSGETLLLDSWDEVRFLEGAVESVEPVKDIFWEDNLRS